MFDPSIPSRRSLILPATDETICQAAARLADGELVGLPTETVYGLAANAWDPSAVRKIFAAKSRPPSNPLIVHLASIERLGDAIAWPPPTVIRRQIDALADLWPGPLTIVCPRSERIPAEVTAGKTSVAIRIPAHRIAQRLLHVCPFPLAAPSANRSGYISPTLAAHVCDASGLGDWVSLVIDGGACVYGVESTILQLGDHPRLLRPGSITVAQLAARLGICPADLQPLGGDQAESPEEPIAPGMLREHYAPSTPLILLPLSSLRHGGGNAGEPSAQQAASGPSGRIAFRPLPVAERANYRIVETLSERGDLTEVARHLFAALRRLDGAGLAVIHCDTCESEGLGQAIMDRLRRAAARTQSLQKDSASKPEGR